MPIIKDPVTGKIIYTQAQHPHNDGTTDSGVESATEFAIADDNDPLKQIHFDPSSQQTETTVTFKTQSTTPGTNVTITFPQLIRLSASPVLLH